MKPELKSLEELVGQLDHLLQEGVVISLEEKAKALRLLEKAEELILEMHHTV